MIDSEATLLVDASDEEGEHFQVGGLSATILGGQIANTANYCY